MKTKTVEVKLAQSLRLGGVELNIKNVSEMKDFYTGTLGLQVLAEDDKKVVLGKNTQPLVTLHKEESLPATQSTHAGLYHFAILFSSRKELAKTLLHALKRSPNSFSGSADHLVSEAFYFYDPEGNGIELYFDRDRSSWLWENNQVKMATLYIDPVKYVEQNIVIDEQNEDVTMGHFHLKVGDIQKAKKFYVDLLGFDVTAELPGALFVSVGGYHHHVGLNSWESLGASERTPSLGLKMIGFILPNTNALDDLKNRLRQNGVSFTEEKQAIHVLDPWKNELTFTVDFNMPSS